MKRSIIPLGVALAILVAGGFVRADDPKPEPPKGERIVLIGGTMIERDQQVGYLETRLTLRNPDRPVIFRNLGWSGDTVEGPSRAGFGSKEDGFKHLIDHVLSLQPTTIIIGYGGNEAFDGPDGLPAFKANLDRLLKALEPTKAHLYFIAPSRQEDLGPPLPNPAVHNADLALYRDALHAAYEAHDKAAEFVDEFVDLFDGSWRAAAVIEPEVMRSDAGAWVMTINRKGQGESIQLVSIAINLELSSPPKLIPGGFRFVATSKVLPYPLPPDGGPAPPEETRTFTAKNFEPGRYALKIDGQAVASADAETWARGVVLTKGPEFDQVEALRRTINAKNELYFYRWRPQNETYLFGFRKYEQGQNAREIPQFDPLVAAKEAEIARLRVPVPHTYELIREGEVGR
jgi:hypothetical protein